jgi:trehalose/maltose hydrolase-like predicted phosphorylase
VDLLERGFTGLETREDLLGFDPFLPDALSRMRFRLRYRRHTEIEVVIDHEALTIGGTAIRSTVLPLRVRDKQFRFDPRGSLQIPLRRRRD